MAAAPHEEVELNQITSPGSQPANVPELAEHHNPAVGEAENLESPPDGQAQEAENHEQSPGAHQQDNAGIGPEAHADGPASQGEPFVKPKEWKSRWLRYSTMAAAVSWTIALMVATIATAVRSIHHHGIISTNPELEVEKSFLIFKFGLGLLWTFIPSVIFQAYALTLAQIVKAASIRQPYVELRRPLESTGVAAEKSILLDYESYWLPFAPFKALEYNHYMLAYSFVLVGVLNLFLAPLTGHLFFAATVPLSHPIDVTQSHALQWESGGTPYSMAPVYGTVSSTLTYGGRPIPWTTLDKSFARVEIPNKLLTATSVTNLTVTTNAYAVDLDCRVLGTGEFEMGRDDEGSWYYSFADRGCSSKSKGFTKAINQFLVDFVKTYYYDCDFDAGYTRVLVIGATHTNASSNDLVNQTAVSCIPTYIDSKGSLTVSIDPSNPHEPTIHGLSDEIPSVHPMPPPYAYVFQRQLTVSTDYVDAVNALEATGYGAVIYNQIQKLNPTSYMTGETLLNATVATFVAAYAITANKYLIQPSAPRTLLAKFSIEDTRVFVDLGVAWTVTGLLVLTLAMLGWVMLYTHRHPSILYEEPRAIVGRSVITHQSALTRRLNEIKPGPCGGKVGEEFVKQEKARTAQHTMMVDKAWIFENWEQPSIASLRSRPGFEPFGYLKQRT